MNPSGIQIPLANQKFEKQQLGGESPPSKNRWECPVCDHAMIMQEKHSIECETCCPSWRCTLQSEEVLLAPTVTEMASMTSQTTGFFDANVGAMVGAGTSPLDYELADAQTSADLASFLSRPVRISSFSWSQSDAPGILQDNIPVWLDFLNNASIKNKLSNYGFLRGNLKLKIVTNASPFLYGSMRAVYQPLPNFKSLTTGSAYPGFLIPASQLPGVWISPAHSEGAEFVCPFVWPRSFIRLGVANDARDMGYLDMTVYNSLLSANGSSSGVTVQIYAWLEDVVLAGPTTGLVLQADEYGVGAVSAPASAVAAVARTFSKTPYIGNFAKATDIGASAVSNIAKLFGYTNVPVIDDTKPMRNSPFPQLATAEIGYVNEKLALDPKNELSIDPAIAGLPGVDELAVSNFVKKESWLTSVQWTSAMVVDTPLFTSVVEPQLGYDSGSTYYFTPMGLCATMFRCWRGDIVYRFKFITSPFHKGRVRISYDPTSTLVQTTADTGPYVFNRIVDLGAETDVEFRIPYQQALPWCYTSSLPSTSTWTTSSTPALTMTDTFHNGMISVKVLTGLSGPTTSTSIGMQVFVRGEENLEFANPNIGNYDLTPFALQSEEYSQQGDAQKDEFGISSSAESHRSLVNFGESVHSLRTLLRRQNLLDTIYIPSAPANSVGVFRINQTRFPAHYGYDPAGWNLAKGTIVPASTFPFNFVLTAPWHLISNCFLAQRGSMNWTYNPSKGANGIVSRISRYNLTFPGYSNNYYSGTNTSTNVIESSYWKNATSTCGGSSLTHTATTNGHSIVAPSYSVFKFQTTQPENATSPYTTSESGYDGTVYDSLMVEFPYDSNSAPVAGSTVERYFGIGADYTLHFFLCCPALTYLSAGGVVPG